MNAYTNRVKRKNKEVIKQAVKKIVRAHVDLNYAQIDTLKLELNFLVYNTIHNELNELENEKTKYPVSIDKGSC